MIKLVYIIARRPDVAPADYYDYWLNTHGPLVRSHAEAIGAKKYVQSHFIETPLNDAFANARGMRGPVAGVTEVWWDSVEALRAAYATPAGIEAGRALAEDEAKFIDFPESQVFMTNEHTIFDYTGERALGPEAIKLVFEVPPNPAMSRADLHATWLNDHGPLVRGLSRDFNARRYVQSHTTEDALNDQFRAGRGLAEPGFGLTEVWFDSLDDLAAGFDGPRGAEIGATLVADERRFVHFPMARCFMTREHVIFDYT